jgi:hypothetical protein
MQGIKIIDVLVNILNCDKYQEWKLIILKKLWATNSPTVLGKDLQKVQTSPAFSSITQTKTHPNLHCWANPLNHPPLLIITPLWISFSPLSNSTSNQSQWMKSDPHIQIQRAVAFLPASSSPPMNMKGQVSLFPGSLIQESTPAVLWTGH